ncbi:efflux RND transporter periplasmic adaptor subunit [Planococcus chinensis]|uniref:HlyD family efflux transporter periplasmic adaptor subunit n=1 Tax=Planococcus chinensis TaxID=272917 RepID=A0ABW4QGM0_9BACL
MGIMNRRKKKKWLIWGISVILAGAVAGAFIFMPKGTVAFQSELAETRDIMTFHNFPGIIDAKNRETVLSDKPMQICDINVNVGDQVRKGDVLMVTAFGEEIKASINGEVAQLGVKENMPMAAGTEMVKLVDYENLETNVKVDEMSIQFLETGQKIKVTINAFAKELSGTIAAISNEAVNENGVAYFSVAVDLEEDEDLRIGMSTEVKIIKEEAKAATVLPMDVIFFDNANKPYVLQPSKDGEPVKKGISTGINDGMVVEVKSGVRAGESVMHEPNEEGLLEQLFWR